jgi:hypothetical protein
MIYGLYFIFYKFILSPKISKKIYTMLLYQSSFELKGKIVPPKMPIYLPKLPKGSQIYANAFN